MERETLNFKEAYEVLEKLNPLCYMGKVKNIVGMMIETAGLKANVGDICF